MANPLTKLKDGTICTVSIFIQTPDYTSDFPFTEIGLKAASKVFELYAKEFRSDDDEYSIRIFSDNQIDCIEYVTVHQLTRSQRLMYRLFTTGFYCTK